MRATLTTWSPDSTKIACDELSTAAGKPTRLVLIDAASGAKTPLATGFFHSQLSFSPDSASLAYVQNPTEMFNSARATLKVIDLATRAVRTIRTGAVSAPAWGPTEIAFATAKRRGRNSTYDTAVVKPDGTGFRRLTRFRPTTELFGPHPVAWSADGIGLLAGMFGLDAWTFNLRAMPIDAIAVASRLHPATGVSPTALSRDGRYMVGQTWAEGTRIAPPRNRPNTLDRRQRRRVLLRQAVNSRASMAKWLWLGVGIAATAAIAATGAFGSSGVKLNPATRNIPDVLGRCSKATALKVAYSVPTGCRPHADEADCPGALRGLCRPRKQRNGRLHCDSFVWADRPMGRLPVDGDGVATRPDPKQRGRPRCRRLRYPRDAILAPLRRRALLSHRRDEVARLALGRHALHRQCLEEGNARRRDTRGHERVFQDSVRKYSVLRLGDCPSVCPLRNQERTQASAASQRARVLDE